MTHCIVRPLTLALSQRERGPEAHMLSELLSYINSIPFIDTHSHIAGFDLGTPVDDKTGRSLPQILMNDYFAYLASSCHDTPVAAAKNGGWKLEDAEEHFKSLLP